MTLQIGMVTFDSLEPRPLAQWWAKAVGGEIVTDMDGMFLMVALPNGAAPALGFQSVPDPTPGKNKLHLDISSTCRDEDVERLIADGATLVAVHDENPDFGWTTLADPDGNQFCISDAQPQG